MGLECCFDEQTANARGLAASEHFHVKKIEILPVHFCHIANQNIVG